MPQMHSQEKNEIMLLLNPGRQLPGREESRMGGRDGTPPVPGVTHRSHWLHLLPQEQMSHSALRPVGALSPAGDGAHAGMALYPSA